MKKVVIANGDGGWTARTVVEPTSLPFALRQDKNADTAQNCLVIVLIELKSGTFKASTVANQLQGGADYVSDIFEGLNEEVRSALSVLKTTCVPILFHGRGIDRAQRYKLESAKVRFRNQRAAIKKNKCGQRRNLAEVLSNAGNL